MNAPVSIIGSSIAGLFAGYHLARVGVPVKVYEARADLTRPTRTLIVTSAWLRLLDFDPEEAVLNRIGAFELISRSASVRIPLREPDLVLERGRILRMLARRMRNGGGDLLFGYRLEGIEECGPGYLLRFGHGSGEESIVTSRVLGTDGVCSTVARAVGKEHLERVAVLQARVPLPSNFPPDTVRVWFDPGSTPFFYWLIPESHRTGVAGLVAETPEEAKHTLERFLVAHDLSPLEYQTAWVPLYTRRVRSQTLMGGGRVLLAGDAAGQVKMTTVGGVVAGMRGALAAARSLLRGTSYTYELRPLRRELDAHALVRHVLNRFTDEDYDELLRLVNRRTSHVLSVYHRDRLIRAFWRLLPAQPRWLLLGARALVRGL